MVEQCRMECAEVGSVSALHTTGTSSTCQHKDGGERPIDTLNERVQLTSSEAVQRDDGKRQRLLSLVQEKARSGREVVGFEAG
jgi:hypothetical protein